jgi:non-specific protein-tyrosine kinase
MEIKRVISLVLRWAWLIILGAVLFGAVTYLINKNTAPIYQASARFLIDEAPGASNGNDYAQILLEQRLAQTYAELINVRSVREATGQRLGLPFSADSLAGKISVLAPEDKQILVITVQDTDAQRAANIANTIGAVFIEQTEARENLRYAEPIAVWQERLGEIGDEIEEIETEINAFGTPESPEAEAALSRLQTQLNEAQIRYTEAFNNRNELQVAQARESSNIIPFEEAHPNPNPIRPRTSANTMMAVAVGIILAVGFIFLVEYLDDTIKAPEQILADTNLSTLGAIAYIPGDKPSDHLVTHQIPRAPVSEAFRMVRTNLNFAAVDNGLHTFMVSSASPSEGKSTTTANLAVVIAQTGKRVLVVDADLRRPVQHQIFEVANNQGLTTAILDNQTPVSDHIQETAVPNLKVMASGPIPPNPAELLNSQRMNQVLAELKEEADVILFDSPPVLSVADASILAPQVDGCLLMVEVAKTRRNIFSQAVTRLSNANVYVYGCIMNRSQPGRRSYYQSDYYYYQYDNYDYNRRTGGNRKAAIRFPRWLSGLSRW